MSSPQLKVQKTIDPYAGLAVLLCIALCYAIKRYTTKSLPRPPGPPGDPIIGHLRHMPQKDPEFKFIEWYDTYGDVVYVEILGRKIVILSSPTACRDLLEKRSAIYSDRPTLTMFTELTGWGNTLTFLPYGNTWRKHRRFIREHFELRVANHRPVQELECALYILDLIKAPDSFQSSIKRYSASITTQITYGHAVTSIDDEYLTRADTAITKTIEGEHVAGSIAEIIPIVKYLPAWLPGMAFKRKANKIFPYVTESLNFPIDDVRRQMREGTAKPSMASILLEAHEKDGVLSKADREDIVGACGTLYGAGVESTAGSVDKFILACLLYPDMYQKAQEEMDRVVGTGRMPELRDRESLPYLEAILIELHRWYPVAALGMSHRVIEDDVYRGWHIPKGATIVTNLRAMCHDAALWPLPTEFDPERYMPDPFSTPLDPRDIVFGFGRRVCPGRAFAETNIWLAIASIVSTLTIKKAIGADGQEITPPLKFSSGLGAHIQAFKCNIAPRSEKTLGLVTQTIAQRQQ